MRFIVTTYGTEGDARPFAALCRGLMEAGHEARLLADAATLGGALDVVAPAPARDRARALGEAMRAEDGVAAAVGVLERIVAG